MCILLLTFQKAQAFLSGLKLQCGILTLQEIRMSISEPISQHLPKGSPGHLNRMDFRIHCTVLFQFLFILR